MPETLLTIQEASKISGKSIQTIRRALKTKKLRAQKKKTPQGFNYLITQDSLSRCYKLSSAIFDREQRGLNQDAENASARVNNFQSAAKQSSKEVSNDFATVDDLKKLEMSIAHLFDDHKKEKETFMRFMKAFQDKFVALENQFKLLEQPKKRWYQIWK